MAPAGLAFAGSMTAADNYAEISVPAAFVDRIAREPSRVRRESMRDIVANTAFRRDLFVMAAQPAKDMGTGVGIGAFDGLAFSLTDLPESLPMSRTRGEIQFDLRAVAPAVRAMHGLLSRGPATMRELHVATRGCDEDDTAFLVQQLVVSGHVAACPPRRASSGWLPVSGALLEAAIREQRQSVPLACPNTGVASDTEVVSAMSIEAATRFDDPQDAGRHVAARLRSHAHPVNRLAANGERRDAADEEIVAHVAAVVRGLRDKANANRRRLALFGIVEA